MTMFSFRASRPGPVLVDADGYTRRMLLSGGPVPWDDPGTLGAFFAKSAGLLQPDAVLLDLAAAWRPSRGTGDVLAAMSRQTRRGRALRTLLNDDGCSHLVAEAARTAAAATGLPVIAMIPSPGRWAHIANRLADVHQTIDPDTTDAAAMYIAGALGRLADLAIAAIVIDEGDVAGDDLPDPDVYTPITNVAAHIRWPVSVRTDNARAWPNGAVDVIASWIGNAPPAGDAPPWGLVSSIGAIPDGSTGAPRIVTVPADADPDVVAAVVGSWGQT